MDNLSSSFIWVLFKKRMSILVTSYGLLNSWLVNEGIFENKCLMKINFCS